MKMLILKDSRVTVKAGETVEVSPAQADFLMSTGSAIPAPAKRKARPHVRPRRRSAAVKGAGPGPAESAS